MVVPSDLGLISLNEDFSAPVSEVLNTTIREAAVQVLPFCLCVPSLLLLQAASLMSLFGGLIADWLHKEKQWSLLKVRTFAQNLACLGEWPSTWIAYSIYQDLANPSLSTASLSTYWMNSQSSQEVGVHVLNMWLSYVYLPKWSRLSTRAL